MQAYIDSICTRSTPPTTTAVRPTRSALLLQSHQRQRQQQLAEAAAAEAARQAGGARRRPSAHLQQPQRAPTQWPQPTPHSLGRPPTPPSRQLQQRQPRRGTARKWTPPLPPRASRSLHTPLRQGRGSASSIENPGSGMQQRHWDEERSSPPRGQGDTSVLSATSPWHPLFSSSPSPATSPQQRPSARTGGAQTPDALSLSPRHRGSAFAEEAVTRAARGGEAAAGAQRILPRSAPSAVWRKWGVEAAAVAVSAAPDAPPPGPWGLQQPQQQQCSVAPAGPSSPSFRAHAVTVAAPHSLQRSPPPPPAQPALLSCSPSRASRAFYEGSAVLSHSGTASPPYSASGAQTLSPDRGYADPVSHACDLFSASPTSSTHRRERGERTAASLRDVHVDEHHHRLHHAQPSWRTAASSSIVNGDRRVGVKTSGVLADSSAVVRLWRSTLDLYMRLKEERMALQPQPSSLAEARHSSVGLKGRQEGAAAKRGEPSARAYLYERDFAKEEGAGVH